MAGHPILTWDSEKDFLEKYRALIEQVERGDNDAYYKVKELRTKEFRNTVDIVDQGRYVTKKVVSMSFQMIQT